MNKQPATTPPAPRSVGPGEAINATLASMESRRCNSHNAAWDSGYMNGKADGIAQERERTAAVLRSFYQDDITARRLVGQIASELGITLEET